MKKFFAALLLIVGIVQTHAKEAYAVFENSTLTLYYDDARSSRGGVQYTVPNNYCELPHIPYLWMPSVSGTPPEHAWYEKADATKKIVFDASFADYRPTNTYGWFTCFAVTEIQGMEYLNTSQVNRMEYMFAGCQYLKQIDLTHFTITEDAWASCLFYSCLKLESATLGDAIYAIPSEMFARCQELTSIVIPKNVRTVGTEVFTLCKKLNSLTVVSDNPVLDSRQGCNAIIETATNKLILGLSISTIPNGITAIGNKAFASTDITTITIPKTVKSIGDRAFSTSSLMTVNSLIEQPFEIATTTFSEATLKNGTLNIPTGTMSLYNACKGWKEFVNIVDPSGERKKERYAFVKDSVLTYCYDGEKSMRDGKIIEFKKNWYKEDCGDLRLDLNWSENGSFKKVIITPAFATIKILLAQEAFKDFSNVTEIEGLQLLDMSSVTDLTSMFSGCKSLKSLDLSHFDTKNVTRMHYMFSHCEKLTSLDVSNFNTSNITDFSNIFYYCRSLKSLDLSSFDTSKATMMRDMFCGCDSLKSLDLSHFNTANVTNMERMFNSCDSLTSLNVSSFNTASVTDMSGMFNSCISLTSLDVSHFNTANVTNMEGMFSDCRSLTSLDVSGFNTANVTNMRNMFNSCSSLTSLDVSHFNTANVIKMGNMFSGCSALTSLDLSSFDTSKVTDMQNLISSYFTPLMTLIIGEYMVPLEKMVTSRGAMIERLIVQSKNPTSISSNCFTDECKAYTTLIVPQGTIDIYKSTDGWKEFATITDDMSERYAILKDSTLTIYFDKEKANREGDTYYYMQRMDRHFYWEPVKASIKSIVIDPSVSRTIPYGAKQWFSGCKNLKEIKGLENVNTESITDMSGMFYGCSSLESIDLSSFNTSNATNLNGMFGGCNSLASLDLSNFNTSNATNISGMFINCRSLTSLDLSSFNTSNVTNISNMFSGCSSLTSLNLSSFDTGNVTDMSTMFYRCSSLTSLDLSNFNTSKVTDIQWMFKECTNLTDLNISSFNTSQVKHMSDLFYECKSLKGIDLKHFDMSNAKYCYSMFYGCTSLESFDVPSSFNEIPASCFNGCTSLGKVTIPNSVKSIGDKAFYNCTRLKEIVSEIEEPFAIAENVFTSRVDDADVFTTATLRVPRGKVTLYKATEGWNKFETITDEDAPSAINTIGETRSVKAAVYNLNGQRMLSPTRGVNIVNGKKVMVR